jgi:hypothetical protein
MKSRFRMISAVNHVYLILVYGLHFIIIPIICRVPTISVLTLALFLCHQCCSKDGEDVDVGDVPKRQS